MIETQNKKIDVAALTDKVNQTLAARFRHESEEPTKNMNSGGFGGIGTNLIQTSLNWTIAEQHANISERSLQMLQYPKPIRWLAKLTGRILLYLSRVITIPQTTFNLNLIEGLKTLTDTVNKLRIRIDNLENIISYQERQLSLQNGYGENRHFFDPFYRTFTDQFRGSREDVKQKLSVYLPLINEINAGADTRPILDVGCGRGEWLELLEKNKLNATGIDLNQKFIEQCLAADLDVAKNDAIHHLHNLPENSLGAVTAFHLIEHMPLPVIMRFFDEALRVLKPGGIAIFETPNPQNLLVGACNFWSDPTHLKPLHPDTQKFLMQYRGFANVRLIYLNPHDDAQRLPEEEAPRLAQRLNTLISCARDYAVIGYKDHSTT